jgi:AcrR family transcriptional regulator
MVAGAALDYSPCPRRILAFVWRGLDMNRANAHILGVPASVRRRPRQERAQVTVEAIIGAARKILVRHGRAGLTTNHVAELAGVSIGSLYQYFPDKDALVHELLGRHIEEARALIAQRLATLIDAEPEEAIRQIVSLMIELHRHDPSLHRALMEHTPGGAVRLGAFEREIVALARLYLERHAQRLRVADLDMAAVIVVQTVEALTHGAVLHRPELLATEAFEREVVDLVTRYLIEPRGGEGSDGSASGAVSR